MRVFFCLVAMIVMGFFDMRIGLLWILLIFAFLLAFVQDCKEIVARKE